MPEDYLHRAGSQSQESQRSNIDKQLMPTGAKVLTPTGENFLPESRRLDQGNTRPEETKSRMSPGSPVDVELKNAENDPGDTRLEITHIIQKKFRSAAALVLKNLKSTGLHFDENNRLIYNVGSIGSHIVELLKFVLYPAGKNIPRTVDATKFTLLLSSLNIPDNILQRRLSKQHGQRTIQPTTARGSFRWSRL